MPDPVKSDPAKSDPVKSDPAKLDQSFGENQTRDGESMLRLVLMGTGPFAVPSFDALLDAGHQCLMVLTRPEKSGNSKKPPEKSPVRQWAEGRGLEVVAPESANSLETLDLLTRLSPDLLVVCDYGQILKRDVLALARLGGINLHGSLLPAHRGAAPVQWSVLKGDQETGVSVIHMTPRLDAGPVISIRKTNVGPKETAGQLEQRLASLGVQATLESVELLMASANQSPDGELDLHGIPQDESLASPAPRLNKADGRIDWTRTFKELDCHVRGMQPWPGAYTEVGSLGKPGLIRLMVLDIDPVDENSLAEHSLGGGGGDGAELGDSDKGDSDKVQPGTVRIVNQRLLVACGDGWVEVQTLKPAGKRDMSGAEWLRGRPIEDGAVMQ